MRGIGIIGLFAIIAAGLGVGVYWYSSHPAPAPLPISTGTPISFTRLASGPQSDVTSRENYLITTDEELRSLWKLVPEGTTPPPVDFTRDDVIAIFAGTEPAAGYAVSIDSIVDTDKRLVTIDIAAPGVTCLAAQTPTTPFLVLKLPKTDLPLTHEDVATTTSCL